MTDDPKELLLEANRLQHQIRRSTTNDRAVLLLWALWIAVFVPPFDFISSNIWGPVIFIAGIIGGVLTSEHYRRRSAKVRPRKRLSPMFWLYWGVFYFLVILVSSYEANNFFLAHTLAAVIACIPLVIVGLRCGNGR